VRSGATVDVLTVFGYGPTSMAPAGPWDQKSGFITEADAAKKRREEDARACRFLGATPRWLDFGAEPYERRGSPEEIRSAVHAQIAGADCVLIPGFPLSHPDHLELAQLLLGAAIPCRVGLYAEQPYQYYERKTMDAAMRAPGIDSLVGPLHWNRVRAERSERHAKTRAVRSYRSQLWQLGLSHIGLYRMLWHEASLGGEAIAWLP
jgi:LmbE family N-acetylglucosaminyl deacetylase